MEGLVIWLCQVHSRSGSVSRTTHVLQAALPASLLLLNGLLNLDVVGRNTNAVLQVFDTSCSDGWSALFDLRGVNEVGGIIIKGFPTEGLISVHPAGDVNGDSVSDLVVTSSAYDNNRGAVWVIYGSQQLAQQVGFTTCSPRLRGRARD
eukprot:819756-Rhodomonas_salina.1